MTQRMSRHRMSLRANIVEQYQTHGVTNAVSVRVQHVTGFVFIGFDRRISSVNFEARVEPLSSQAISSFFEFDTFFLLASADMEVVVSEMWLENVAPIMQTNLTQIQVAQPSASPVVPLLGLSARDLNLQPVTRRIGVDIREDALKRPWVNIHNTTDVDAVNFESLSVGTSVISLTPGVLVGTTQTQILVEGASIRYRVDGGVPTATVGILATIGETVRLNSSLNIRNFRAIATGAVVATMQVTYFAARPLLNVGTWSIIPSLDEFWQSVTWSPERSIFVAVGTSGGERSVMTSPDGISWTIHASDGNMWGAVCWSPERGIFVAVATSGTGNRVMTSRDGITWTSRSSAANNEWRSVCWSPERGIFVAVAQTGLGNRVMTSPDGISWTSRTSVVENNWVSVCWSPERGLFVAVAWSGVGNRVMTSPDGITWTIRASAADIAWWSVTWSPERRIFVAVSQSGIGNHVMTSPDGIAWTIRASAADNNWFSVCWSPERGIFVAVAITGVGNRVMTSPDGIAWTIRASAADNNWKSVCWSPERGIFVSVADTGVGNHVMINSPT